MRAAITGSAGLIGSECVPLLSEQGWDIIGIDNDMRRQFFGHSTCPRYLHAPLDIRDRQGIRDLVESERPDFIIHTAAQPSHDKSASIPYDDFDVNATGTLNLLVAARDFCRESPFCFTGANKVYGDLPKIVDAIEERHLQSAPVGRVTHGNQGY